MAKFNVLLVSALLSVSGCYASHNANVECRSPEITSNSHTHEIAPELLEVYGCETFADMATANDLSAFCATISEDEDGGFSGEPESSCVCAGPGCGNCDWYWYCGT